MVLSSAWLGCAAQQPQPEQGIRWPPGDARAGREAFIRAGCAGCHTVEGAGDMPEPQVRPAVPVIFGRTKASRPTTDRWVESIVNPDVHLAEAHRAEAVKLGDGSRMPGLLSGPDGA
ncbi:MAG: c-type cytochrome [Myxococcales bacterium]|nr:c-type cytochrome [Myxococcales bacterium]